MLKNELLPKINHRYLLLKYPSPAKSAYICIDSASKYKNMSQNIFIGRKKEQAILRKTLTTREAEFVAVIGRRRVGKTFLIKSVLGECLTFELSGIRNAPSDEQRNNIVLQINKTFHPETPIETPDNWLATFYLLTKQLEVVQEAGKR